jgi:hypothetical protein
MFEIAISVVHPESQVSLQVEHRRSFESLEGLKVYADIWFLPSAICGDCLPRCNRSNSAHAPEYIFADCACSIPSLPFPRRHVATLRARALKTALVP